MDFALRGKKYPIVNASDIFLIKIEKALVSSFTQIEDDINTAYVVSKCCPGIPKDIVYYASPSDFLLNLSSGEILIFSFALTIAVLQKMSAKAPADQQIIDEKIKQLESLISETSSTINSEQLKALKSNVEDVRGLLAEQKIEDKGLSNLTNGDYTTVGTQESPLSAEEEETYQRLQMKLAGR